MPSNKNNGFNDMQSDDPAKQTMDQYNQQMQQQLDDDDQRRKKGLNDFLNHTLDPDNNPNPQQTPTVKPPLLTKLQKYMPTTQEDVVPYDPNSGTLTNIGRFALNNLATDRFGGGFPAAGALKVVEEGAEMIPEAQKLLMKAAPEASNLTQAKNSADTMAEMAQSGMANADDIARSQQALSRAVDFEQRNRLAKIKSLLGKK